MALKVTTDEMRSKAAQLDKLGADIVELSGNMLKAANELQGMSESKVVDAFQKTASEFDTVCKKNMSEVNEVTKEVVNRANKFDEVDSVK